uniref:NMDA receptor synaptonuclear signaling and neuronal migration factor n=1 Tax=Mus spicilegus TaxID=10103 RepID=A0A8C6N1A4_MUSSI
MGAAASRRRALRSEAMSSVAAKVRAARAFGEYLSQSHPENRNGADDVPIRTWFPKENLFSFQTATTTMQAISVFRGYAERKRRKRENDSASVIQRNFRKHLRMPTHFPLLLLNSAFSSLGLEATSQHSGLGVWWGQPGLGLGRQEPHHCGGGPRSVTPGWRVK